MDDVVLQPAESLPDGTPRGGIRHSGRPADSAAKVPLDDRALRLRDYVSEPVYVYAIGRIAPRFPNLGLEKEFSQVRSQVDTRSLTDAQAVHTVLSQPANRYVLGQLCWVFAVEGIETYLLRPRSPAALDLFVEAIRRDPGPADIDVVIGVLGEIAPPMMCNGLALPIVDVDHLYSFDQEALVESLPVRSDDQQSQFAQTAREVFGRVRQIADNAGATDGHRALNYVSVRYPTVYTHTFDMHSNDWALTSVETLTSRLTGPRRIVDVVISYTHRERDVIERYFTRVDVTDEFPFLVTKLTPYFER